MNRRGIFKFLGLLPFAAVVPIAHTTAATPKTADPETIRRIASEATAAGVRQALRQYDAQLPGRMREMARRGTWPLGIIEIDSTIDISGAAP